ncbi:lipid A biosynthesis protein [Gangjinia marincola]|uniref:Lipid A biosynthesis protein n=1 Tax=Gangjinia marincola TaxID=578463 RepID=A0ABN1MG82_9FLAO
MQAVVYGLTYPFLWLVSRLPFPLFYAVSDGVYFLVYRIFKYRKKVVKKNLRIVFPDKSSEEINQITSSFYKHMCDMFLEMIKSISISDKELKKRFTFANLEEMQKLGAQNKGTILLCAHYASFEWMNALEFYDYGHDHGVGIYKKVANTYFDRLIRKKRSKYNTDLIPNRQASTYLAHKKKENIKVICAIVTDQTPKPKSAIYWRSFLNQVVPVFTGAERLAQKLDMNVAYLHVEKLKRGHYQATFKVITSQAPQEDQFAITDRYFELLEDQIYTRPELYLWTHKRFKHVDAKPREDAVVRSL